MARTLDRCGGLKAVAFSLSASWFIFLFFLCGFCTCIVWLCALFKHRSLLKLDATHPVTV